MDTRLHTILCAFKADLFGECLFNHCGGLTIGKSNVIECRVDPCLLSCLKDVLSIDYTVRTHTPPTTPTGKPPKQHWFVTGRKADDDGATACCWHLIITTVGAGRWHTYGCDFDVYMLTYNKTSLYVRLSYDAFDQHPEVQHKGQIAHMLTRIQQRRFCLLPTGGLDPDTLIKAYKLVANGWTMDDMLMPGCSWLVTEIKPTAQPQQSHPRNPNLTAQECAICKEDFQAGDIVIQLTCSHVFHVHCQGSQDNKHSCSQSCLGHTTGLHAWVHTHKKTTCPMCRAPFTHRPPS